MPLTSKILWADNGFIWISTILLLNFHTVGNNGKNNNANEEAEKPKPKPKKAVKLTEAERKALKTSTQFGELQMVNLWNKWKFSFPTGLANRIQLKQVFKEVSFWKCN